jgi:hypothetical protein
VSSKQLAVSSGKDKTLKPMDSRQNHAGMTGWGVDSRQNHAGMTGWGADSRQNHAGRTGWGMDSR